MRLPTLCFEALVKDRLILWLANELSFNINQKYYADEKQICSMEAARQFVLLLWNWVDLALDSGWQFSDSAHD